MVTETLAQRCETPHSIEAMVSFPKALAEGPTPALPAEFQASSNKRKWDEPFAQEFFKDQPKAEKRKSFFDIELHLETPLPSHKGQQYHSIQSGQTHLFNTRMNKKAAEDPKRSPEPPSPDHMSLDLGLNLTCESLGKKERGSYDINEKQNRSSSESSKHKDSGGLTPSPSWLSSEADQKEMVATVCMRCHMLVMLCKSSPTCPNCKFMHPPDQNSSTFLKRRCSLLC